VATKDETLDLAAIDAAARAIFAGSLRIEQRRGASGWVAQQAVPEARASAVPRIVVDRVAGALRVVAVDEAGEARGLAAGLGLAEARARVPDVIALTADPVSDALLLADIADWCDRYTPLVALDGHDGLMLDVTGCTHLFASEAALLDDVGMRLRAQGFAVCAALAPTPGAAWALARFGAGGVIAERGEIPARLAPAPLAALRLEAATVAALERVGLKTIGDVWERPRAPLARRFGPELLRRLDQAAGRLDEPISPRRPVPALIVERRLVEPILSETDVLQVVQSLAEGLAQGLDRRGEGARGLDLALYRVDGKVERLSVGTSRPLRDPGLITGLFAQKLAGLADPLDAGFGFDWVRLGVSISTPDGPTQADLGGRPAVEADLDRLVDRLGARFGLEAIERLIPNDTHRPEAASLAVPAAVGRPDPGAWAQAAPVGLAEGDLAQGDLVPGDPALTEAGAPIERPILLLERAEPVDAVAEVPEGPPLRFRWRRALYTVARVEGPERIAAPWWEEGVDAPLRDYFRIEDADGRRFWLYREGVFDAGRPPRWWVQGLFA
jgi:protein ImuB